MKEALTREYLGRDSDDDDGTLIPKMAYGQDDDLQRIDCNVYHRCNMQVVDANRVCEKCLTIRRDVDVATQESMAVDVFTCS